MTTLREAAQQALEALESKYIVNCGAWRFQQDRAITALRAALAEDALQRLSDIHQEMEAQQEPVAIALHTGTRQGIKWLQYVDHNKPLYIAPPQRKPLSDEQIEQAYRYIWRNLPDDFVHTSMGWIEQGIRYAEQANGIGEKHD